MDYGACLHVVVHKHAVSLKLFVVEDQPLLVRRNSFLVMDLVLDVVDSIGCFDNQGEGLASERFDVDQYKFAQHEVECGLILNVVVRQRPSGLKLLAGKDQPLMGWMNSFLVLDLGLDNVNGFRRLDVQCDGLDVKNIDEDLYASTEEQQHTVEWGLLLDVVVQKCPAILELLASEDQPLLVRRHSLLFLDLGLDIVNCVGCLGVQGDDLACERDHEDLHGRDLFELGRTGPVAAHNNLSQMATN